MTGVVNKNTTPRRDPFAAALVCLLQNDSRQAAVYLQEAMGDGVVEAGFHLGILLIYGLGVKADPAKGQMLVIDAALNGCPGAMEQLGIWYSRGTFGERNDQKAFLYTKAAAEGGVVEAKLRLAHMLFLGIGVPRNYPESLRWACQAGLVQPFPWHNLGRLSNREIDYEFKRAFLITRLRANQLYWWVRRLLRTSPAG